MIPQSELILNDDGSIYHLGLTPQDICQNIITVGDPDRVAAIAVYLDEVYFEKKFREFASVKGRIGDVDLLIISTGIGTDNIDIVFNELDALANIDLYTRTTRPDFTQLHFYRLGTSGSISSDVAMGSILISKYAIGLDALMTFYNYVLDDELRAFQESLKVGLLQEYKHCYVAEARSDRYEIFKESGFMEGITVTAPGFYGPQGRKLRMMPSNNALIQDLSKISYNGVGVTNLEMETAGIYAMSNALGHQAISINAILASRINGTFESDPASKVRNMIVRSLDIIVSQQGN